MSVRCRGEDETLRGTGRWEPSQDSMPKLADGGVRRKGEGERRLEADACEGGKKDVEDTHPCADCGRKVGSFDLKVLFAAGS